jgi:hypothetical protein
MSKNKKKRNKTYSGAASTKPIITRIEAANRNKPSQWWFDNKKIAKPVMIAIIVVFFVVIIVAQIISLLS